MNKRDFLDNLRVARNLFVHGGVTTDSGAWEQGVVRGFRKFRQQRLALICAAFEKAAGMRLFRKG